jgi:capsular exopolysaccharide synthesis family protein
MWLIMTTALIVTAITFVITLLWWLYWPMYTAEAALWVTPPNVGPLTGNPELASKDIMDRLLRSHAQMVMSNPVLEKAATNTRLTNTKWYNEDKTNAVRRLAKEISVNPLANTSYIQVSMTAKAVSDDDRTELAEIVNAVAEEAEKYSSSGSRVDRQGEIDRLKTLGDSLRTDLDNIRRDPLTAAPTENLQERADVLNMELRTWSDQLIRMELYRAGAEASLAAFQEQKKNNTIAASPEVLRALEMDSTLMTLRNRVLDLSAQQERMLSKYGQKATPLQSVEALLESTKRQAEAREKMLTAQAIGLMETQRQADVASVTSQITDILNKLNATRAQYSDIQSKLTRQQQIRIQERNLEERIDTIQDKMLPLQDLATGERQLTLRIQAVPPTERSMPKWGIMMPLGVILGIALGFGLAFLLEFADTSIKGPSDITRRVDLPLLGMVPHLDDVEEEIGDLRLAFITHPNSLIGEAFRQIRTCLAFSGPPSQRRSLLVTSPLPEDGRTTIALNLAAAIAQGGRTVLIVDANFRQPAIRKLFPDCPDGGLSSALVGQMNWPDLVREVRPRLYVMPAGVMPPNPAELLGSDEMRKILSEMVERYDQVLIDGAPCLVVTDSPILSTLVDGVVLTVRAGANTYGIVQRARDTLRRVGAHIVGVALNGVRITAGGYLRQSYETFYQYHEQSRTPVA